MKHNKIKNNILVKVVLLTLSLGLMSSYVYAQEVNSSVTAQPDQVTHYSSDNAVVDFTQNDTIVNSAVGYGNVTITYNPDSINATIVTSDTGAAPVINITGPTRPGVHPLRYIICDVIVPTDCTPETDITVTTNKNRFVANNDTYSLQLGNEPYVITGGSNVIDNDIFLNASTTQSNRSLATTTLITNGGMTSLTLSSDGQLFWSAYEAKGQYTITYKLCEVPLFSENIEIASKNFVEKIFSFFINKVFAADDLTENCSVGQVTINILADQIVANPDEKTITKGSVINLDLLVNDTLASSTFAVSDANTVTLIDNGGLASTTISAEGILNSTNTATPGVYSIKYQICQAISVSISQNDSFMSKFKVAFKDKLFTKTYAQSEPTYPTNCTTSSATITITEPAPVVVQQISGGGGGSISYSPSLYLTNTLSSTTSVASSTIGTSTLKTLDNLTKNTDSNIASTTCKSLLVKDIVIGKNNDTQEVNKLIAFLNDYQKETLKIDGTYDADDFEAVKRFQSRYASTVLLPWGGKGATGIVAEYTRNKINVLYCSKDSTCPHFTEYLKLGSVSKEVIVVKNYLNIILGKNLVVNNIFDKELFNTVKEYQEAYRSEVLTPWGLKKSTGYWYKTTRYASNSIVGCKEAVFPTLEGVISNQN